MIKDTKLSYTYAVPTRILFGAGRLNDLAQESLPGKRALITISNGKSTRASGLLDRVEGILDARGISHVCYNNIQPNPTVENVDQGGRMAREEGCDFIIVIGGGSVMDATKGIATVATNPGTIWDYIGFGTGGKKAINIDPLPIVAITTTAGTGSESDAGAVITNPVTNEKTVLFGEKLFPVLAIIDPEWMTSVPKMYTAYQGFDALFHSTEGYIANTGNLASDMFAITAIENVGHFLAKATQDGNDLEARAHVAFANSLSSFVMTIGTCTSEHSLEHALSAYHPNLPHGAGLIMISKAYYTHFINKHVADERFVRMAQALGMSDAREPMDFIRALDALQHNCNVDTLKMSDYGITPEEFGKMAENAMDNMGFLFGCDRVALSVEDCKAIYQASYR